MSLNRTEQQLLDYVQRHPEERHYWQQKVRALASGQADVHAASVLLDALLRAYLLERAGVVKEFFEYAPGKAKPVSLRNLADYWLRLWVAPKPSRPGTAGMRG